MVLSRDNVRVISAAGDVEIVGADTIAKLSAETSEDRPPAAWDQRIVIRRGWASSWGWKHYSRSDHPHDTSS